MLLSLCWLPSLASAGHYPSGNHTACPTYSTLTCAGHGQCFAFGASYACACFEGFAGADCAVVLSCDPSSTRLPCSGARVASLLKRALCARLHAACLMRKTARVTSLLKRACLQHSSPQAKACVAVGAASVRQAMAVSFVRWTRHVLSMPRQAWLAQERSAQLTRACVGRIAVAWRARNRTPNGERSRHQPPRPQAPVNMPEISNAIRYASILEGGVCFSVSVHRNSLERRVKKKRPKMRIPMFM